MVKTYETSCTALSDKSQTKCSYLNKCNEHYLRMAKQCSLLHAFLAKLSVVTREPYCGMCLRFGDEAPIVKSDTVLTEIYQDLNKFIDDNILFLYAELLLATYSQRLANYRYWKNQPLLTSDQKQRWSSLHRKRKESDIHAYHSDCHHFVAFTNEPAQVHGWL